MTMGTRTMRQVVERLRGENAEALLELYEFEYAMIEVHRYLDSLARALREHQSEVSRLGSESAPDPSAVRALEENSARLAARAEQIAGALAEFCRGLRGWGISEGS
jgi:hypothetical protein